MKIWKLLSALILTVVLIVTFPLILQRLGLIAALNSKAKFILGATAIGLVFKLILGDLGSGKFDYHKHGYDLCIMTLAASLSGLSLQLTAERDLYSGIPATGWLRSGLESLTTDPKSQSTILLFGVFLLACILSLITARILMSIREDGVKGKNYLSLLNFLLGAGVFGIYIWMLITKG